MKKLIQMGILLISTPFLSHAAIGCMSRSANLDSSYDYKNYHYVQCNCPCGSSSRYAILSPQGICRECGHYHELKPIHIIKGSVSKLSAKISKNPFIRFFQQKNSLFF